MTYLGKGKVCLGNQGYRKTIQINYKMNFVQDSCQRFSLHFESNFHWRLQVYCIMQKRTYFSRLSFSLNHSSVSWDISLLHFFILNFKCFGQNELIKVQIFRLATARMKINQIPHVIFQSTSQFLLKFCIILQYYDTQLLCTFLTQT